MYINITEHGPNILAFYVNDTIDVLLANHYKLELTTLGSLDVVGVSIVASTLIISAVIGSYCKIAVYQYMFHTIKEDGLTPIDILILANSIIQHLMILIPVFTYIMKLTFDDIDEKWCNVSWYAGIFGGAYRVFGSLGIALYRLFLLKRTDWLSSFGKKKMAFLVLNISFVICIGLSIGFGTGNGPASRKQVTWNWCVGRSERFREILHELSLINGSATNESE